MVMRSWQKVAFWGGCPQAEQSVKFSFWNPSSGKALRQLILAYLGLVTNAEAYDQAHFASTPSLASVGWPPLLLRLW